jgi:hypothetical protein
MKPGDVKVGDWLTCIDAVGNHLFIGRDYRIREIANDAGDVFVDGDPLPWRLRRFKRRPFRVGDVVECVVGDSASRAVVRAVSESGDVVDVTSHCLSVNFFPASSVRLITPAHLAKPPKDPAQSAEPPRDDVNHPPHYTQHPSGVECIAIVEHMTFNRGNAIKYLWRAGEKGDKLEDLKKAAWYVQREISRIEKQRAKQ